MSDQATQQPSLHHLDRLLTQHLKAFIGEFDANAFELLLGHLEWVELAGGQTLMNQGDPGDSMYMIVSGRLRTYIADDEGHQRVVREITRGQVVGEMSLFTDEPRSATLVAIRDTVLVRLGKDKFQELLSISSAMSIALTRQIIKRLQTEGARSSMDRPVTIGLLPLSKGLDVRLFADRLASQLAQKGRVAVVDSSRLNAESAASEASGHPQDHVDTSRRAAIRLDEIESENDFVLLIGDDAPTAWTQRCTRHCDELYLLADADDPPQISPIEKAFLVERPARTDAAEILVLLHPKDRHMPSGTGAWLARRPVAGHLHIRPELDRDLSRLSRIISRTAVGLVFAGGGAKGLAHLGVCRALQERGIEIDVVGGTSIGSVMATYVASDQPVEQVIDNARRAFATNPTGDFNLIPMLSLLKGQRLRRVVGKALTELSGRTDLQIEDLWKTFYCVATNYSRSSEQVLKDGPLLQAMLASIAIPGALPPVIHKGDLLCDGGTFNNFPVDVMRGLRGIGHVIGVDLSVRRTRRIEHVDVPGSLALLLDRFRPRHKRRYRLPSLATYLINVTVLYSNSRERQTRRLTDVHMNPPLERIGMLQWDRFDEIVEQGYRHACEVLERSKTSD